MSAKTTYTTTGSVRGGCGHSHREIRTAAACLARDQAGCKAQGGYSDRHVETTDGERLSECESLTVESSVAVTYELQGHDMNSGHAREFARGELRQLLVVLNRQVFAKGARL